MRVFLFILALMVPVNMAAQVSIGSLRNSLIEFALDQISSPGSFEVTAASVEDGEEGQIRLLGVSVSDGVGVWLTIGQIDIDWNSSAILRGNLDINSAQFADVRLIRLPDDSAEAPQLDVERTQGTPSPFDWPRSPISVNVETLTLVNIFVSDQVLPQPVRFNAAGSFSDSGDEQSVDLTILRTDQVEGQIILNYLRDFAANTVDISLTAEEAPNGIVAAILGLPNQSATQIALYGDGPQSAWELDFAAGITDVFDASGTAVIDYVAPISASADFEFRPGSLMNPTTARILGDVARLSVQVGEDEDGIITISDMSITTPAVTLNSTGLYDRDSTQLDLEIDVSGAGLLADFVDGFTFETAQFDGRIAGPISDLIAEGALTVQGTESVSVDVQRMDLLVRAELSQPLSVEGTGFASGLRIDQLGPDVIGDVDLSLALSQQDGIISLRTARIESPALQAQASGQIGPGQSIAVDYLLETDALGPIAEVYGQQADGRLRAEGQFLRLSSGDPTLTGNVALRETTLSNRELGTIIFDHSLRLGDAVRGSAVLATDGGIADGALIETAFALEEGTFSLRNLTGRFRSLDISGGVAVQTATGALNGSLQLGATAISDLDQAFNLGLDGRGTVSGSLQLRSDAGQQSVFIVLDGRQISIGSLDMIAADLDVQISDAFGTPSIVTDLTVSELALSQDIRLTTAQVTAGGPLTNMSFSVSGSGRSGLEPLTISAAGIVNVSDNTTRVTINPLTLDIDEDTLRQDGPLRVTLQNGITRLDNIALTSTRGGLLSGLVSVYGAGMSGDLVASQFDIGILERFGVPFTGGQLSGEARFDTRPGRANAAVELRIDEVQTSTAVQAAGRIDLVTQMAWNGRQADITVEGQGNFGDPIRGQLTLPLVAARSGPLPRIVQNGALSGQLQWQGELGPLWAAVPVRGQILSGMTNFDLQITGTPRAYQINGALTLENGRYENLGLGVILTDVSISSQLENLSEFALDISASDGGEGRVTGQLSLISSDGPLEIEAAFLANRAVLVRRDDATAMFSGTLEINGPVTGPTASGDITIDRAEIRLVNATPAEIISLGDVRIAGQPAAPKEEFRESRTTLDLTISTPGLIFIRGRGLESEWAADLRVQGTARLPRVSGEITRLRGNFSLLGRLFDIEEGRIIFNGRPGVNPDLRVTLAREDDGLTGRILIRGTARDPVLRFASEPVLPQDEILPRLLFGRSQQSLDPVQTLQLASGIATLLSGRAGPLDAARNILGVDVLQITPTEDGDSALTIGTNLADGVFVGAEQNLIDGTSAIRIEIDVIRNVTIDGIVTQDGNSSVGITWSRDF